MIGCAGLVRRTRSRPPKSSRCRSGSPEALHHHSLDRQDKGLSASRVPRTICRSAGHGQQYSECGGGYPGNASCSHSMPATPRIRSRRLARTRCGRCSSHAPGTCQREDGHNGWLDAPPFWSAMSCHPCTSWCMPPNSSTRPTAHRCIHWRCMVACCKAGSLPCQAAHKACPQALESSQCVAPLFAALLHSRMCSHSIQTTLTTSSPQDRRTPSPWSSQQRKVEPLRGLCCSHVQQPKASV